MKPPPLLIGAALLFWGQQTGYLFAAIPMALALEGTRLIKRRWELSPRDFHRIADLCALIFIVMFVVRFAANTASVGRWIPFGLFPLVLAQALSTSKGVDLGALFYTMRKREKEGGFKRRRTADVSWPAFVLILVAASAANVRTSVFYAGVFLLTGWALASIRPKRYHPILWVILLMVVGGLGWAGQYHLRRLHLVIEKAAIDWYMERMGMDRNPFRNVTAIGDVGELKQSNRIVLRVRPEGDLPASHLLRDASYNIYHSGFWLASGAKFQPVLPEDDGRSWQVGDGVELGLPLHITARLVGEKSIISLPMGTGFIKRLPAALLEQNRFGTVRVQDGPKLARYRTYFKEGFNRDAPPNLRDLEIPDKERDAINQVGEELHLSRRPAREIVAVLHNYFQNRFQYSLTLPKSRRDVTPITDFLLQSRSGHCEFFATAGVLLLRAGGVPARYATGYRVDEFSRLEGQYVVRARHAHAWATAYLDGQWQAVDLTPPGWLAMEAKDAPWLEPAFDLFRWIGFQFTKWRWSGDEGPPLYLLWVILPLFIILAWRVLVRKRDSLVEKTVASRGTRLSRSDAESSFQRVDELLSRKGFQRREWETQQARLRRLEDAGADTRATVRLDRILALHYHVRFRPGEPQETTEELERAVDAWMAAYGSGDLLFPADRKASGDGA